MIQSVPSLGAILLWLAGKDVQWWAAVLGLVFILLQTLHLLWRWRRENRRAARDDTAPLVQATDFDRL